MICQPYGCEGCETPSGPLAFVGISGGSSGPGRCLFVCKPCLDRAAESRAEVLAQYQERYGYLTAEQS